jgi:hypothetical protein
MAEVYLIPIRSFFDKLGPKMQLLGNLTRELESIVYYGVQYLYLDSGGAAVDALVVRSIAIGLSRRARF